MRQILSDLHSIQSKLYHPGIFGFTKRSPIFRVAAGRGEPLNARRWFALLGSVVRSVGSFLTGNGARASRGRELRARISGKKGESLCTRLHKIHGCAKHPVDWTKPAEPLAGAGDFPQSSQIGRTDGIFPGSANQSG